MSHAKHSARPTVAYLTAGGAGMFCGSCMRDNTLAAALGRLSCDVQLIPTYTPIRTDEENVSVDEVFFGGVNVYLRQRFSWWRRLPRFLTSPLDSRFVLNAVGKLGIKTQARDLGALTVSMLRGELGTEGAEIRRLCEWLRTHHRPDLINFSNILIGGCIPALKRELGVPIVVTLQGDDLFLDDLVEPHKSQALAEIRRIGESVDAYVTFSRFYADAMAIFLGLPRERFHIVPLGLDPRDFQGAPPPLADDRPPTLGYLARICPAKGFHLLVDAFLDLKRRPDGTKVKLRCAGWLGANDMEFFEEQKRKIRDAGHESDFHYAGVVDRAGKVSFLQSIDVFSAPTVYEEPKG
ncbi:MAG: glycosyltransferase family 4 protein, partial [Planctomycetia bacterium]